MADLPRYVNRAEWAEPAGFPIVDPSWSTYPNSSYVGSESHHTVIRAGRYLDIADHARAVEELHRGRGWKGGFYAHLIHPWTGDIAALRDWNRSQGTATTWGHGENGQTGRLHVVCFAGDLRSDNVQAPGWSSWWFLRRLLELRALRPHRDLVSWGHKDRPTLTPSQATYCPGPIVSGTVAQAPNQPNPWRFLMSDTTPTGPPAEWEIRAAEWAIAVGLTESVNSGPETPNMVRVWEVLRKYNRHLEKRLAAIVDELRQEIDAAGTTGPTLDKEAIQKLVRNAVDAAVIGRPVTIDATGRITS